MRTLRTPPPPPPPPPPLIRDYDTFLYTYAYKFVKSSVICPYGGGGGGGGGGGCCPLSSNSTSVCVCVWGGCCPLSADSTVPPSLPHKGVCVDTNMPRLARYSGGHYIIIHSVHSKRFIKQWHLALELSCGTLLPSSTC